MFLLFNHALTDDQIADARESLGIDEFVELPKELIEAWGNVPPELEDLSEYIMQFIEFLESAKEGEYVLLSGDFGACHRLALWAKDRGLKPVYATTKREAVEVSLPNGGIEKKSVFKHIRFRGW